MSSHDQGQILGTELNLMEIMTENQYTHLQHIIQTHMEGQPTDQEGKDVRFLQTKFDLSYLATQPGTTISYTESTAISPPTTQAIDLSTSNDDQSAIPHQHELSQHEPGDIQELEMVLACSGGGLSLEKTPTTCGEVPGSVLDRVKTDVDESQAEAPANSLCCLLTRPHSSARVCLEKRFNCMPGDISRQQDTQPSVLSNFLTMLQQSSESQETSIHPQMQKWMRYDQTNAIELSNPYVGALFNPITAVCGQTFGHISHMVEPNNQVPKNLSFSHCTERVAAKAQCINQADYRNCVNVEKDTVPKPTAPIEHTRVRGPRIQRVANAAPDLERTEASVKAGKSSRKRAGPQTNFSQRRESHNIKERDRRKRIRVSCNELNSLVPFCTPATDKANTLQRTTVFLKYIKKMYGDSIKEEFQNTFFIKPSTDSDQAHVHQEMADTTSAPLAAEQ